MEEALIQDQAEKGRRQGENKWTVVETGKSSMWEGSIWNSHEKILPNGCELSFPPKGPMIKELCVRASLTLASTMQNQLLEEILFQIWEREFASLPAQAWH